MFLPYIQVKPLEKLEDLAEAVNEQAPVKNWSELQTFIEKGIDWCIQAGGSVIAALIIYFVGRCLIYLIKKFVNRILSRNRVDPSIRTFTRSLVNITLNVLLAIAIMSKLGVETTSFAALLASAGVAIGMALSGNLSNFAGGLVILMFRPYKVGDYIEFQGYKGTVVEIQIFHTVLTMMGGRAVYLPNGQVSSGCVVNWSKEPISRVDMTISVEYGQDFDAVKEVILDICKADSRILKDPEPSVVLKELAASSVDIGLWAWVKKDDFWPVKLDLNRVIYTTFNQKEIAFPFPQITVHQGVPTKRYKREQEQEKAKETIS